MIGQLSFPLPFSEYGIPLDNLNLPLTKFCVCGGGHESGGVHDLDAVLSKTRFAHLKALEVVRHETWKQLKEA